MKVHVAHPTTQDLELPDSFDFDAAWGELIQSPKPFEIPKPPKDHWSAQIALEFSERIPSPTANNMVRCWMHAEKALRDNPGKHWASGRGSPDWCAEIVKKVIQEKDTRSETQTHQEVIEVLGEMFPGERTLEDLEEIGPDNVCL